VDAGLAADRATDGSWSLFERNGRG